MSDQNGLGRITSSIAIERLRAFTQPRPKPDLHPFGTLKMRMGATHFLCVTLPKVATEMALCVLGYNLTRVLNIVGMKPLLAAVRA